MISNGVDIVSIKYIRNEINKGPSFIKRVFTHKEISYCNKSPRAIQHFASRFAAKEAFMKAISTGWTNGVQWNQIEVLNLKNGKPFINLHGKTKMIYSNLNYSNISISMSHDCNFAVAFVIVS